MRIYLIGLPGVGKTTIAKVLSERLKWQYIDLDVAIEARENMQISEIFTLKGEPYFREKETNLLNELSEVPNLIISCGGGIVLNNTNLENGVKVAEKLRKIIEKMSFDYDDLSIKITSSFGVCEVSEKEDPFDTIKNADEKLYMAKMTGRNKTVF